MSQHLQLVVEVTGLLDRLGIPYVIGGSVASSLLGEPRSTVDIDIAVALHRDGLDHLLAAARPTFYIPEREAQRAVDEFDSFNLIHSQEAIKVDLFVLGPGTLDRNQLERRIVVELPTDPIASVYITAAEDQVLRKLDWHRRSGSERQWRDVIAILRLNHQTLDDSYLRATADGVGLTVLLDRALSEASATQIANADSSGSRPSIDVLVTHDVTTPPPAVSIVQMTDGEYGRFINMLIWLVKDEEEAVGQIGLPSVERGTTWGPWPRRDCGQILQRWHDAGFLAVHRFDGELAEPDARAILSDAERWSSFGDRQEPFVAATEYGAAQPDPYWFDRVRDLRSNNG